jgi:hypothetical protein
MLIFDITYPHTQDAPTFSAMPRPMTAAKSAHIESFCRSA